MFLLAALIAATPLAVPPAKTPVGKPICRNNIQATPVAGKTTPGIHPLTQEPPAREIKAVVRTLDGCNRPIVVADRVGRSQR